MVINCIIFARSTDEADCQIQLKQCHELLSKYKYINFYGEYAVKGKYNDDVVMQTKNSIIQSVLGDHEIRIVLITSYDRWTRDNYEFYKTLEAFQPKGCLLASIPILKETLQKPYREWRSMRIKEGIAKKRKEKEQYACNSESEQ